jgi:hypothetical protein
VGRRHRLIERPRPRNPEVTLDQKPQEQNTTTPEGELSPEREPVTTGTLFILLVFLMALAGLWGIMYFTLLGR